MSEPRPDMTDDLEGDGFGLDQDVCGEQFYGDLAPGQISGMDWSVPRICTRPPGHVGYHSRWPQDEDRE